MTTSHILAKLTSDLTKGKRDILNWKTLLKSFTSKDMRNRFFAVIGLIVIYRFLCHIPVPMAEPTQLKEAMTQIIDSSSFGGFMNLLSGGALTSISIMLVGLSPYITASVVMQMLSKAIPKLEEISQDGESGRRRINQWTRVLTLPLAIFQSIAYIFILRSNALGTTAIIGDMTPMQWALSIVAMTAGALLVMWIGEIITEKGIGNGITILIVVGILSQMPTTIGMIWTSMTTPAGDPFHLFNWFEISWLNNTATWTVLGMLLATLIILYILVKINEGQRVITIDYAKRVHGNSQYGGVKSIIPIKLISAGVIPVIFAVAFLSLPAFVGQLMRALGWNADLGSKLMLWFQRSAGTSGIVTGWQAYIYPVCYFLLVILFTYFYTSIVFNSKEIASNLQKQGGFIENVRPGKQTEKYLSRIVKRLTLFGSIALGIISIMPFIGESILVNSGMTQIAGNLSLGGTGLLIVVTGALDCIRQLNSRALMVSYDEYK